MSSWLHSHLTTVNLACLCGENDIFASLYLAREALKKVQFKNKLENQSAVAVGFNFIEKARKELLMRCNKSENFLSRKRRTAHSLWPWHWKSESKGSKNRSRRLIIFRWWCKILQQADDDGNRLNGGTAALYQNLKLRQLSIKRVTEFWLRRKNFSRSNRNICRTTAKRRKNSTRSLEGPVKCQFLF